MFFLACATTAVSQDPAAVEVAPVEPAADPATATVPTLLGDAPGVAFLGDWTSASCGGRDHARNVRFESDHTYAVIDLVSPCPPGTTCAWSGLVTFAGEWRQAGTKLNLRELGISAGGPGSPHPQFFESTADGKLVEGGCAYERGLTVPPGYSEEKLRPKVPGR